MTLFCYVQGGSVIDGPRRLPRVWKDRTDFHLTPTVDLIALGWLPCNAIEGCPYSSPTVYPEMVEYVVDLCCVQTQRNAVMWQSYNTEMAQPFVSSALGEPYEYSTHIEARIDLIGAAAKGSDILYACRRVSDGLKTSFLHTAAQMAQVLTEGADHRESLVSKLNNRLAEIAQAPNIETVQSITWNP